MSQTTKQKESNPEMRIESDSMGEIEVPADKYWGAQTERNPRGARQVKT